MQLFMVVILFVVVVSTSLAFPGHYANSNHHVDYHAHPKYHYDYAVHNLHTGDVKNKWETRDGDVVKGAYSLNQPDGTILKVEYNADKHNGYNAVVKRLGKSLHPKPVHHHEEGAALKGGFEGHLQ